MDSEYSEDERREPFRQLLREALPDQDAATNEEVASLSGTQLRDRLIAHKPLDRDWIARVNQVTAAERDLALLHQRPFRIPGMGLVLHSKVHQLSKEFVHCTISGRCQAGSIQERMVSTTIMYLSINCRRRLTSGRGARVTGLGGVMRSWALTVVESSGCSKWPSQQAHKSEHLEQNLSPCVLHPPMHCPPQPVEMPVWNHTFWTFSAGPPNYDAPVLHGTSAVGCWRPVGAESKQT